MQYLSHLRNPLIAGIVAGLIIVIVLFIDSKYNDKDTQNDTYMKAFGITAAVAAFLVYYVKGDVIVKKSSHRGGMEVMDGLPEF